MEIETLSKDTLSKDTLINIIDECPDDTKNEEKQRIFSTYPFASVNKTIVQENL